VPDLENITGFEWDAGNEAKSAQKYSVERSEAEEVFLNQPLVLLDDAAHSRDEPRYRAFGKTKAGRWLQVSYTIRGNLIRVISARPMNRRERKVFESKS
jgi:hypothetical protein